MTFMGAKVRIFYEIGMRMLSQSPPKTKNPNLAIGIFALQDGLEPTTP